MRPGHLIPSVYIWVAAATVSVASAACRDALPRTPPDAGRDPDERTELAATSNGGRARSIEVSTVCGRLVPAVLLVGPRAVDRRLAGIVLQHDVGGRAKSLLSEGRALAAAGAVVLMPDWALGREGWPSDGSELWQCAIEAVQRSFDVLTARADVDPERLAFLGVGFGASVGALVATTDSRIRALAFVEPDGDARGGGYSRVRWRWSLEHPPTLFQFGVVERDSTDADLEVWQATAAAGDQVHWYESAWEPDAVETRRSFLASNLALAHGGVGSR